MHEQALKAVNRSPCRTGTSPWCVLTVNFLAPSHMPSMNPGTSSIEFRSIRVPPSMIRFAGGTGAHEMPRNHVDLGVCRHRIKLYQVFPSSCTRWGFALSMGAREYSVVQPSWALQTSNQDATKYLRKFVVMSTLCTSSPVGRHALRLVGLPKQFDFFRRLVSSCRASERELSSSQGRLVFVASSYVEQNTCNRRCIFGTSAAHCTSKKSRFELLVKAVLGRATMFCSLRPRVSSFSCRGNVPHTYYALPATRITHMYII